MHAEDFRREIAAITPHVTGTALELPGVSPGLLGGTRYLSRPWQGGSHDFSDVADGSADAIVAIGPIEAVTDWVAEIDAWRRVLREGGEVAIAGGSELFGLAALLAELGGFDPTTVEPLPDRGHVLLARRCAVAAVRQPLQHFASRALKLVAGDAEARAEFYYQIGALLLQAGDPELARSCFERLLDSEVARGGGLLGLGMCAGSAGAWDEARQHLEQAMTCDPDNPEVSRWLERALVEAGAVEA